VEERFVVTASVHLTHGRPTHASVWQIRVMSFPPPRIDNARVPMRRDVTTASAGWYDDPHTPTLLRWWDGSAWTNHVAVRPDPPGTSRPDPGIDLTLGVAFGVIAVLVVSLVASRFVLDALVPQGWPIVVYVFISGVVGYGPVLVWSVVAARRAGGTSFRDAVGLRFRAADLGWGPLIWVACVVAQMAVTAVVLASGVPTTSNTESVEGVGADRSYVIALLVLAVVAAPVVEEIAFRGVVLRGLRSAMPVWVAVVIQGFVFGLAHVDPVRGWGNIGLAVILGVVGIVLGTAAQLIGRLAPVMIAHAVFNGVVMVIVLSGVAAR
jgi:uncharacterized protein